MIGIFLITHGSLGQSLAESVHHILGEKQGQLAALGVGPTDGPEEVLPVAQRMLDEVDSGEGVLVLTDIYGATPANIASKLIDTGRVEGLAGVSLPMLLRASTHRKRDLDLDTLVDRAISGSREGVLRMT